MPMMPTRVPSFAPCLSNGSYIVIPACLCGKRERSAPPRCRNAAAAAADAAVQWGTAPGAYGSNASATFSTYGAGDMCPGGHADTPHGFNVPPENTYRSQMGPLVPLTTYYYRVGADTAGWSKEFSFMAPPVGAESDVRVILYADVGETYRDGSQSHWMEPSAVNTTNGAAGSAGAPPAATGGNVLSAVKKRVATRKLRGDLKTAGLIHVGDLAYATGYASEWDRFMEMVEPLAAAMPCVEKALLLLRPAWPAPHLASLSGT
jgi:hypothetical protein